MSWMTDALGCCFPGCCFKDPEKKRSERKKSDWKGRKLQIAPENGQTTEHLIRSVREMPLNPTTPRVTPLVSSRRDDPHLRLFDAAMLERGEIAFTPEIWSSCLDREAALFSKKAKKQTESLFKEALRKHDVFIQNILIKELSLDCFECYADSLHQSINELDALLSSYLNDSKQKETLSLCLLGAFEREIEKAQHNCQAKIFNDSSLSKEEKLHALAQKTVLAIAMKEWIQIQQVFGGKLAFHNLFHSRKVALTAAKLTERVEFIDWGKRYVSLQSLNFLAAAFHDSVMIYNDGAHPYKRSSGISQNASEGASVAYCMHRLKQEHRKIEEQFAKQVAELIDPCDGEFFLFHRRQIDLIREAIESTVPRIDDFKGPRQERLQTVANGGELYTPYYEEVGFKDPAMNGRDPATHAFSQSNRELIESRLAFYRQSFLDRPGSFEKALQTLFYLAVPVSDLSSAAIKEPLLPIFSALKEARASSISSSWLFGESFGLWCEEHPDEALSILRKNEAAGNSSEEGINNDADGHLLGKDLLDNFENGTAALSEAERSLAQFLQFMQGQKAFGLGRLTAMQERVYFPLLVIELELEDMKTAGGNPSLLSEDWPVEKIAQRLQGVKSMRENFEKLYCDENAILASICSNLQHDTGILVKDMHRDTLQSLEALNDYFLEQSVADLFKTFSLIQRLRSGRPDVAVSDEFEAFRCTCLAMGTEAVL